MANKKVTDLPALASPAHDDVVLGVDVSGGAQGTSSQVKIEELPFPGIEVSTYGALGDGTTDDQSTIQAAINACPRGGIVYLDPGKVYAIASPIDLKPFVTLQGHFKKQTEINTKGASIIPKSTFSGTAAIRLKDKEEGGYSEDNYGARLVNITLDGSNISGSKSGVQATGDVRNVIMDRVTIQNFPSHGISCENYTRISTVVYKPIAWDLWNCMTHDNVGNGYNMQSGNPDYSFINCYALGNDGHGFYLTGSRNTRLTACNAEWNLNGYYLTGSWDAGAYGGVLMTGCTTDRNTRNGVFIDSTGKGIHHLVGLSCRRDGRNAASGGGSYASLQIASATTPVIVDGIVTFPGVDDDGTGTNSPDYGVSVTGSTWVAINSGYLHAAVAGYNDGGTNTTLLRGPNVGTATGSYANPTRALITPWTFNGQLTIAMTTADATGIRITNTQANANGPQFEGVASLATGRIFNGSVTGDSVRRWNLLASGKQEWGPGGSTARDTNLYRASAGVLQTDNYFTASQGFIFPQFTSTQRDAISSPTEGLTIYNITTHKLNVFTGSVWEAVTSA